MAINFAELDASGKGTSPLSKPKSTDYTDYLTLGSSFGPLAFAGVQELKIEKDEEIIELREIIEALVHRIEELENK